MSQAKGAPKFIEFILGVMDDRAILNTYTEGYREERAYHDGKAHAYLEMTDLLRSLNIE